jgi:hypothetical protein
MKYEKALELIEIEYVGGFAEAESEYRAKIGGEIVGIGESPQEAIQNIAQRQSVMLKERAKVRQISAELAGVAKYF